MWTSARNSPPASQPLSCSLYSLIWILIFFPVFLCVYPLLAKITTDRIIKHITPSKIKFFLLVMRHKALCLRHCFFIQLTVHAVQVHQSPAWLTVYLSHKLLTWNLSHLHASPGFSSLFFLSTLQDFAERKNKTGLWIRIQEGKIWEKNRKK